MNIIQELTEWMRNASPEEQEGRIHEAFYIMENSVSKGLSELEQQYALITEPTIADAEKYIQLKTELEESYETVQELRKNITRLQEIKKKENLQKATITTAEIDTTIAAELVENNQTH